MKISLPNCFSFALALLLAASFSGGLALAAEGDSSDGKKYPPYEEVLKDAKTVDGLIKLHHKGNRVYAEISSGQFNQDFIVLISIARGIGQGSLLGGMSWGFGDDALWQFRKVDENIHIVRRNVRFKASAGSPEEQAVKLAYTDSVLFSLPVATKSPGGNVVVDLTPVFMSDLPQISQSLPGFSFAGNKSTWAAVKGFPQNVELEVAATYASSGTRQLDTVPDSRGVTINVHYSISRLPSSNYKPRLADDRVGYFLTVVKDFSKKGNDDQFVRYINRWDLQKKDSSLDVSPPENPIIFWLEKTIPVKYRKPISEGILEWNKAFEKAGFDRAIQVRQQEEGDDWDPEDVRYNTFRWITSNAGFAMGPSRVNPTSGQIIDADIIFDADFVQYWKDEYETFTPESIAAMTGGALDLESYRAELARVPARNQHAYLCQCDLHRGLPRELAFGSAVVSAMADGPARGAEQERMVMEGLKEVTMHEVGHTLGLRHNFKSSTMLSSKQLHDMEKTSQVGLTASVMDYAPANLAPKGAKQGHYFSPTLGPYDHWAIEYGYKAVSGGSTDGELAELKKIASRGSESELAYATDEDTRGIDPDPLSNRFDLGEDPIEYARLRAELIKELWPGLADRVTEDGDGFQRARQAFGILLGQHGRAMFFASRYVGGVYVNRDHKGDKDARPPFVVVEPEKQRQALEILEAQVFNDKPFDFPPELYNHLAASRWNHWGSSFPLRVDYPVHEVIGMWQDRILSQLLSSLTLERLHDSELKISADEDALTTAELIERLTQSIYSEVDGLEAGDYTNRKPAISSLRRDLQRRYLKQLAELALGAGFAPEDCQTVAFLQLKELEGRIKKALESDVKLDTYSRAHLEESAGRIHKVVDARLTIFQP